MSDQLNLNGFAVDADGGVSASKLKSTGAKVSKRSGQTLAYQILVTDNIVGYTALAAARIATLPPVANVDIGHEVTLKDEVGNAGTNSLTLKGSGSESIDGANTHVISSNYGSVTVYSTGTAWAKK